MTQTLHQRLDGACDARGWRWAAFRVELASRTADAYWGLIYEPPEASTSKDDQWILFLGDQLREAGLDPTETDRTGRIGGTAIVGFVGAHPGKTVLKMLLEIAVGEDGNTRA
jgi:hypothetical protein